MNSKGREMDLNRQISFEKGIYLVKPDAFMHRDEIRRVLSTRMMIERTGILTLDESIVSQLYPLDVDKPFFPHVLEYLVSGPSEVNAVQGVNVYRNLVELIGDHPDTQKCRPDTLRYKYGAGIKQINQHIVYRNGIHRTQNTEEFAQDSRIFDKFLG